LWQMNQQRAETSRMTQDEMDRRTNNCLFLVRNLRARAHKLHEDIFTSLEEKDSPEEMRKRIVPLCVKLNKNYDELETSATNLPEKTTVDKEKFERLKLLFQEEKIDTVHSELIDKLIRATNYNEGNLQINFYLSTFMGAARRKNFSMIPHSVSYSKFDIKSNPHALFEQCLLSVNKELQLKKYGVFVNVIERNCYSSIFEIRSGNFMDKGRSREFVCLQKTIMVENGGSIDKCIFFAPNEEPVQMDDFGEKRMDLRISSRYEIYRRLSINTNLYLLQSAVFQSPQHLLQIITQISKVHQVLETPCKFCKKLLKDFMPPTVFAYNQPRSCHHESCR
ncbi:hypothetical protein PFISCL1PPCAC_24432, partial [Pristionchus fissidentatus]